MNTSSLSLFGLIVILCAGCRSVDPYQYPIRVKGSPYSKTSEWHTIRIPARTPIEVTYKQACNPVWWFGNARQPMAPDWYRPGQECRDVLWLCRNPMHNFTFHVVGLAHKDTARSGRFPDTTFNPYGGWSYNVTKLGRWRLPYVSYQKGRTHFYFGWRSAGNFGVRFTINKPPNKPSS